MAVLTETEIAALTPQERLALIDKLRESFEGDPAAENSSEPALLSKAERRIIDDRLSDIEAHPLDELSLAEARQQHSL